MLGINKEHTYAGGEEQDGGERETRAGMQTTKFS